MAKLFLLLSTASAVILQGDGEGERKKVEGKLNSWLHDDYLHGKYLPYYRHDLLRPTF